MYAYSMKVASQLRTVCVRAYMCVYVYMYVHNTCSMRSEGLTSANNDLCTYACMYMHAFIFMHWMHAFKVWCGVCVCVCVCNNMHTFHVDQIYESFCICMYVCMCVHVYVSAMTHLHSRFRPHMSWRGLAYTHAFTHTYMHVCTADLTFQYAGWVSI